MVVTLGVDTNLTASGGTTVAGSCCTFVLKWPGSGRNWKCVWGCSWDGTAWLVLYDCVAAILRDCCFKSARTSSVCRVLPVVSPLPATFPLTLVMAANRCWIGSATEARSCSIPEGRATFWATVVDWVWADGEVCCWAMRGLVSWAEPWGRLVLACCWRVLCLKRRSCWWVKFPLLAMRVLLISLTLVVTLNVLAGTYIHVCVHMNTIRVL